MKDTQPTNAQLSTGHRITTPDGRTLAVDITGPADGPTLLFVHSAPGSRRCDPDPAVTAARGIRLVTFDRAGYGDSTPLPADSLPSIEGHAADAALVAEALEAGPVDVVGWSAGGRIAAALAAGRPELVRSIAIVATPAPEDEVPWVPDAYKPMTAQLRTDPSTAYAHLIEAFEAMGMTESIAADDDVAAGQVSGGDGDAALLAERPDIKAAVVTMVRAGTANGVQGMTADIVSDQIAPWDFDLSAVIAPTTCWYGTDDAIVTPAHGDWWASQIPGATTHEVDGIGHLVITTAWPDILDARP
ncbi:MAG: hypothetical protein JWM89_2445 [Acidimicrobiales bacterium]|nr:hypothetical protein [Acidimicrobiales bacterium]